MIHNFSVFREETRYSNNSSLTLKALADMIIEAVESEGAPVSVRYDKIKVDGVVKECAVFFHPDHENNYHNFAVTLSHQYNSAYAGVYLCGQSSQLRKQEAAQSAKKGMTALGKQALNSLAHNDESISGLFRSSWNGFVGSVKFVKNVGRAVSAIGSSASKREEELRWYSVLGDSINSIL